MANEDFQDIVDIPTLDLCEVMSALEDKNTKKQEGLKELMESCDKWGCFRVINHGIEESLLKSADKVCKDLFELPTEIKSKNAELSKARYAYIGGIAAVPYYESLAFNLGLESVHDFALRMWPQGNQRFCDIMEEFEKRMKRVVHSLVEGILTGLGVENHIDSLWNMCCFQLRMNHYKAREEGLSCDLGLAPHTDLSFLGALFEDGIGGLQFLKNDEWIDVKSVPGSLVVFMGDITKSWSNGRVKNPIHRVIIKEKQPARLSIGLFAIFPEEIDVEAPPELVDHDGENHYRKFRINEFMSFKYGEAAFLPNALEVFAAISHPLEPQLN